MTVTRLAVELVIEIHNKYLKVFSKIKEYLENNSFGEFYFDVCYDQIYLQTDFSKYYNYNDDSHYEILPFSMLYGLLEDFFYKKEIEITYHYSIQRNKYKYFIYSKKENKEYYDIVWYKRNEAKYQAILKACEILEGRL